jgi:hypothetical protein
MKKTAVFLLLAIVLTSMTLYIQESRATLVPYDVFSSGDIDLSKWNVWPGPVADSDSIFSIVSGAAAGVSQTNVLHASGAGNTSSALFATQHLTSPFDGAYINFFNFNLPGWISFIIGDSQNHFQISVWKGLNGEDSAYQHLDMFHSHKNEDGSWSGDLLYTSYNISQAEGVLAIGEDKHGGLYLNYSNTGYIRENIEWTKKYNFGSFTFPSTSNPFLEIFVSADNDGNEPNEYSILDVGGLYLHSVPEPSTLLLLGLGLMGLAGVRRKFKK